MNSTSNQSPSINHMHIITLLETSHSRMINKYLINKNHSYITSIKSRKHITAIFIYIQKNRDNRIIHSIFIININYKNQNQDHKKYHEKST